MGTWLNSDGLYLEFGTTKAEPTVVGEFRTDGPIRCLEVKFDYTQLPLVASNSVVIDDSAALPVGALIEGVEIQNSVDFNSGDNGELLNVGTIDLDRTSNGTADSLVVAATQAELNAGGKNVAGWVGALVGGAPLATAKLLTWEVDASQPTAGAAVIRVYYSVP